MATEGTDVTEREVCSTLFMDITDAPLWENAMPATTQWPRSSRASRAVRGVLVIMGTHFP